MTQLFAADGTVQPATVLRAGPCVVSQVKTVDRDGYEAVQLGFVDARPSRENKATEGHFKKAGVPPTRIRREVRIKPGGDPLKAGDQVNVSIFADGERVDVIGTSRGKGFQGVVKRHHFRGGRATHGSMFHRAPGSIGASSYPSRVVKGMRMAGHMGAGPGDGAQPQGPSRGRREQPPVGRGRRAWRPQQRGCHQEGDRGQAGESGTGRTGEEEGQEVMTVDVVNAQNEKVGSFELRDEVFGGRIKTDLIHESVVRANAAERRGTHATKTRAHGQRQRQEAVAPEGDRPCARRRDPQPAVAQGRHGVRPAAAQLRVPSPEEGREGRAARRARAEAARRPGRRGRRS